MDFIKNNNNYNTKRANCRRRHTSNADCVAFVRENFFADRELPVVRLRESERVLLIGRVKNMVSDDGIFFRTVPVPVASMGFIAPYIF